MQEFAPKNESPPPTEHWPSSEELAAYIDGTLDEAERERITEHLASCEECYFVYSETLHFQVESEPVNVVQFPSRGQTNVRWWYAATAALVALGVGIGWFLFQRALIGPAPTIQVAEAAPDVGGRPLKGLLWDHGRFRGEPGSEEHIDIVETDLGPKSFQVGALLVDFQLCSQARDAKNAADRWQTIGTVVKSVDLMEDEGKGIQGESQDIKTGKLSLETAAANARIKEKEWGDSESSGLDPGYVDLGKWTEAGRIAAKKGDRSFFHTPRNRRFLFHILRNQEMNLEPEVRHELQEIARIWERRDLRATDFAGLEQRFQAILDRYDIRP